MKVSVVVASKIRAVILGGLSVLVGPGTSLDARAQPTWHNLEAGEYAVGFWLMEERDTTRVVPGPADPARPVRIYLWYPATSQHERRGPWGYCRRDRGLPETARDES
jgi:hypothetical protein